MLNKLRAFCMLAVVATISGFAMAKTYQVVEETTAPVLTTVYDDEHTNASQIADRKEKEAMRALVEAQEAHDRASKLAAAAASKSQQDALAQAEAARASFKKAQGAQTAATNILLARNNRAAGL